MKASRYTFLFSVDGEKRLAYNALTNGLALVDEACADCLASFSEEKFVSLPEETQRQLQRGGFVLPDELDERDVVRVRYRMHQYATGHIGLTIGPTLACNLACRYCFESSFKGFMSDETQSAVVRFASELIEAGAKALDVTWYGGEPLLGLDTIEALSQAFLSLTEEKQASYQASIITNGTLLTEEVAHRLVAAKVSSAQVTLDGPPEVHDQRRPFRSGGPSYAKIVANLQEAIKLLPISLRVNVDRHNAEQALVFVENLMAESWFDAERVQVHFGYVRKYTPSCGCGLDEMLKPSEFWALQEELGKRLVARGLAQPLYPDLASGCTATSVSSFVIGPQGELYRCWNHVGDRKAIVGTVFDSAINHPLYVQYLVAGFEEDPECLECRFLPICAGGCVDVRVKASKGLLPSKDCSGWRYYLERQLVSYYRWWWQERQKEKAHEA